MNKKDSIKKNKQGKDKRPKKKAMGRILGVYKEAGQGSMLRLRKIGEWVELSRWALHPKKYRWAHFILSRRECAWLLLSLQHQLRRQLVGIRNKTRAGKSKRTLSPKRKDIKSRRKLVPIKNRSLSK